MPNVSLADLSRTFSRTLSGAAHRARGPALVVAAAGLPAAAIAAALSLTGATEARYPPAPPPPPSPWLVAQAENTVPGACQIAARVVVGDRGAAGATLRLARLHDGGDEGAAETWGAVTDADGAHRFLDLPPGTYHLTALAEGRAPAASPEWRCGGANERAFFTLPLVEGAHELAGVVRSRAGGLAPGAELAIAQEHDARTALAGPARIPVEPDGTFSVRLAPGRYAVLVQAPNHAPLTRALTIGDAPAARAAFALTPAPRIRGRVLDETGAPVPGALVALGGVLDPKARAPSVRTDAQGAFALPVSLGMDVVVTARGRTSAGEGVVARAALGTALSPFGFTGVDLVARAGRAVQGVVERPDGSPWAFGEVRYRIKALGLTGTEKADASGRFVLAGMPPDADVEVWAEGNATGAWGAQVATPGNDRLALLYVPPAY